MYRNYYDITSNEGVHIDAGSLWRRSGQLMILVDDDQYISFPYYETEFYED